MSTRAILFALICLIALSSSVVALRQQFLLQQLRQSLVECRDNAHVMQTRVAQLEDNLRSAGQQMNNLSGIIQETTRRAARCQAERND
jgi:septal ring factor EnvC (AmiA/AmiB activator)